MDHSRYHDHDTSTTPDTRYEDTTPQSQLARDLEYERMANEHKSATTDNHSHNSAHKAKGY